MQVVLMLYQLEIKYFDFAILYYEADELEEVDAFEPDDEVEVVIYVVVKYEFDVYA